MAQFKGAFCEAASKDSFSKLFSNGLCVHGVACRTTKIAKSSPDHLDECSKAHAAIRSLIYCLRFNTMFLILMNFMNLLRRTCKHHNKSQCLMTNFTRRPYDRTPLPYADT